MGCGVRGGGGGRESIKESHLEAKEGGGALPRDERPTALLPQRRGQLRPLGTTLLDPQPPLVEHHQLLVGEGLQTAKREKKRIRLLAYGRNGVATYGEKGCTSTASPKAASSPWMAASSEGASVAAPAASFGVLAESLRLERDVFLVFWGIF